MDVDNERLATDDEHMDYEEDPGSGRDDDGDEMMEDDVGGNQDAMDAESIPNTTDAPIPFPVATNHTLLTETAPILSPTSNAPGSAGLVSQPLPVLTGSAPKTEMLPVIEKPTLLNPKRESGEDPLKCMESSMPSTPFQVQNAPTLFGENPKPQLSPAHQPIPTIVEETNMLAGPSRPVAQTTDAARSPRPNNGDDGDGDGGDEEEYYEEGPDDPIDTQSLPPIILNLPALGARILFAPLPDDGQQQKLPVWLSGRQEELGEASLSDIWVAIRAEMVREGLAKVGEMVVTERQMDLKMGEDDVNLQSITFLELLQLYLGCDLPTPVQLYTSFEPNRFIGRYSAISNELKMQNERRKRTAVAAEGDIQHVNGDEEAEEEDVRNEDGEEEYLEEAYDNDDGYGGAEQRSEVGETRKRSEEEDTLRDRRARGHEDDARAEYGGSRRAQIAERPPQDHPHADWARGLPTSPLRVPGAKRVMSRSAREIDATVPAPADPPRAVERRTAERRHEGDESSMGGKSDHDDAKDTEYSNTSEDMQSREHAQAANADLIDTMSYTNVRLDDDQLSQVSTRGGARSDDLYGEVSSRLDRVTAALPDEIDVSRNNAAIGDTVNDEYAGEVPAAEAVKAMIHPEDRYPSPITSMDSLRDEARTRVPVARPVADVPLNGLAEHGVENGNPITVIPLAVDANAISGMSPTTNTVDSAIGEVTAGLSEIGAEDPGYKVATDPKYRAAVEDTVRAEADASRLRAEDMVAGNGIERGALIGSRSNAGGYMRDRDQGAYGVDDRSVESTYAEEVRSENPITPVTPDTAVDGESAALLDDEEYYDEDASEAAYEDPVTPPGESVVLESSAMASPLIQDSENLDPTSVANIRAPEDGAVASPLVQDSDNLEESPIAVGRDPAIESTDAVSVVPVESAASEYESLTATGDSSAATGAASASPVELTSRLEDSTLRSPASTSTLGGDPDEDIEGEDGEDGQGDYEGYESQSEPLDSIYTEDPAKSVLSPRQSLTSPTKRSMGDVSLVASDEAYADSVISSKKPRFSPTGDYPPT